MCALRSATSSTGRRLARPKPAGTVRRLGGRRGGAKIISPAAKPPSKSPLPARASLIGRTQMGRVPATGQHGGPASILTRRRAARRAGQDGPTA